MIELKIRLNNLLWVNSSCVEVYEAEEVMVFEVSLWNTDMSAISLSNVASLIAPKGSHDGVFDSMSYNMIKDSRVILLSRFIRTDLTNTLFLSV